MQRRLPKRGFYSLFKKEYAVVNIADLEKFESGSVITPKELVNKGVVKKITERVKILGDGELHKALTVKAHKFSGVAAERIRSAGGEVEVI